MAIDYERKKNTNTKFGGTDSIEMPKGTTAERSGTEVGQLRYNTSTGFAEVYGSQGWGVFGAPPPTISGVSPSSYNGESGTLITINGSNFSSGLTISFITAQGTEIPAAVSTFVNSSQATATTPQDFTVSQGPLDIKLTQTSGIATLNDGLSTGSGPSWSTAAGSLGTVNSGAVSSLSVTATDPDAGATIAYSLQSGSLPGGISINTGTGALAGTFGSVSSDTTFSFTIRATDNAGNTSDRSFSIIVRSAFLAASGGNTISTDGNFRYHIFNSGGTFTVNGVGGDATYGNKVRYLIVAGGGGGGGFGSTDNFGSGGGGGAGGYLSSGSDDSAGAYNVTVSATSYPISVGGGGSGGVGTGQGSNGGTSSAFGFTATGGGGGGRQDLNGNNGGSGGGGGTDGAGRDSVSAGTPGQGNPGGRGAPSQSGMGGGGGGAGGTGSTGNADKTGGAGGPGASSNITGSSVVRAGGGGGASYPGGPHPNTAPSNGGGGGTGNLSPEGNGTPGTANTGGGGGAANDQDPRNSPEFAGGSGGSGVVIVRYRYQ